MPFAWPRSFPVRTILPLRALYALDDGGPRQKGTSALFEAYWTQGRDIAEPAVVKAALDGAGLDGAALLTRTEEPAIKEALRLATDSAVARGVFGVPTFFVGDEMFFGNDRLDFVGEALRGK